MVFFALYDENHDEYVQLIASIKDNMAFLSDEELKLDACEKSKQFGDMISSGSIFDMGCLDITGKAGTDIAENFRKIHKNAMIMLIADSKMSPLDYIKPTIMAAGLMLRPCDKDRAYETIGSFMKDYLALHSEKSEMEFVVETRDDIIRIPYDKIYYIEAKNKKVFIRVRYEEYGYYDTLDNLMDELPGNFVRCHRGYIVNTDKIKKIINNENMIELEEDLFIPVSRGMKKAIKELII